MQHRYLGEVGISITFVSHIFSVHSVPNIVEIGQHMYTNTTEKWTGDCIWLTLYTYIELSQYDMFYTDYIDVATI